MSAKCFVISSLRFRRSSVGPWIYLQGIIFLVQAAAYHSLLPARVKVKWPSKWFEKDICTSLFCPRRVQGPPGAVAGIGLPKGTVGCGVEVEGLLLPLFLGLVIGYPWTRQRRVNGVQNMSTNSQQSKWSPVIAPNHKQVQKRAMNTPQQLVILWIAKYSPKTINSAQKPIN